MKEQDFKIREEIIRETFNDTRKIKCITPEKDRKLNDNVHPGGDIFTTEDGDFIDLEFQLDDFTIDELIKYIEFAEELYEKHHRHVSVYLLCPDIVDVYVREGEIKSEADFTIKLACVEQNLPQMTLDIIKNKLKREGFLDREDLEILEILPIVCKRKDRKYFRREYLKIMNRIHY